MTTFAFLRITAFVFALYSIIVNEASATEAPSVVALWEEASLAYLLTPSLGDSLHLQLAPQFEVVDGANIIVLTKDGNLFDLSSQKYLPGTLPLNISSFTFSEGVLVVIHNDRLGWYQDKTIIEKIALPLKRMKVFAGSKRRLYLYGSRGRGTLK